MILLWLNINDNTEKIIKYLYLFYEGKLYLFHTYVVCYCYYKSTAI